MATGGIVIRRAEARDVDACLEIQASQMDTTFSRADYLNSSVNSNSIYLVAELESRVVGFIVGFVVPTKNSEAIVHSTMVHMSFTKRGIGSALVRGFVDFAFKQGLLRVYAEVESGPDRFYEKCGFRKEMAYHSMLITNPSI